MHKRIVVVLVVHGFFAFSSEWITTSVNLLQPFIMEFANQSFYNHYHVVLDSFGFNWLWSAMAMSVNVGNLIGALSIGFMMEKFGRREICMKVYNGLVIVASILHLVALRFNAFESIIIGRLVNGIADTYNTVLIIYITESVAHNIRGCVIILLTVGGSIFGMTGMLLVLPQILGNKELWIYFFALPIFPAAIHFSASFFFARSPKYVYINKHEKDEAINAIQFYHGPHVNVDEILGEFDREADLATNQGSLKLKTLFQVRHLRIPLFICIVASLAASFNGNTIAIQYGRPIIENFGVSQNLSVIVMIAIGIGVFVGHIIISFCVIDRLGRRPLLLSAIFVAILGLTLLFVSELLDTHDLNEIVLGLIGIGFFTGSDVLCIGIIAALLVGEVCPQISRAKTTSIVTSVNVITSLIQVLAYPPLNQAIGAYCFIPVIFIECLCLIWLIIYLPETKRLPVDQIVSQWIIQVNEEEAALVQSIDNQSEIEVFQDISNHIE